MALRAAFARAGFGATRRGGLLAPFPVAGAAPVALRSAGPGMRHHYTGPVHDVKVPTIESAKTMPQCVTELSNETLYILAEGGCHDACTERLVRNVMCVDNVEWLEAQKVVKKIAAKNDEVLYLVTLPYKVGFSIAAVSGFASIPMVFDIHTATWFNQHFVTSDVPDQKDLETWLEVGSWAWNWMEPPLGTASFVLLALQFMRSQMVNMDMHPYSSYVKQYRAKRLCEAYPDYNEEYLSDFAATASLKTFRD